VVYNPIEVEGEYKADPSHAEMNGLPAGESDHAMFIVYLIAEDR